MLTCQRPPHTRVGRMADPISIRFIGNLGRSIRSASRQTRSLGLVRVARYFLSWLLPADGDVSMSGLAGCSGQGPIPGATDVGAFNEVITMEHRPDSWAREAGIAARREGSDPCRPG